MRPREIHVVALLLRLSSRRLAHAILLMYALRP